MEKPVDKDIFRMLTRQGFSDLFWQRLQEARKLNPAVTQKEVFDELNAKYYTATGIFRYSSYDSFRLANNRQDKNNKIDINT